MLLIPLNWKRQKSKIWYNNYVHHLSRTPFCFPFAKHVGKLVKEQVKPFFVKNKLFTKCNTAIFTEKL